MRRCVSSTEVMSVLVQTQQIDRAALAEDRECDLEQHAPSGRLHDRSSSCDQRRMTLVHESIKRTTSPAHIDVSQRVDRREEVPDGPDRQQGYMSTLDA